MINLSLFSDRTLLEPVFGHHSWVINLYQGRRIAWNGGARIHEDSTTITIETTAAIIQRREKYRRCPLCERTSLRRPKSPRRSRCSPELRRSTRQSRARLADGPINLSVFTVTRRVSSWRKKSRARRLRRTGNRRSLCRRPYRSPLLFTFGARRARAKRRRSPPLAVRSYRNRRLLRLGILGAMATRKLNPGLVPLRNGDPGVWPVTSAHENSEPPVFPFTSRSAYR